MKGFRLTNPSCYALMSDMEGKASLMRDIGIDMRFVGSTCTEFYFNNLLWQGIILYHAGESWNGSMPWKSWSLFCWQRWNWSTHGGILLSHKVIELLPFDCSDLYICGASMLIFGMLMLQIIELPNHPYFIGVQFHPEFKSRPGKPSPLFLGNCLACTKLSTQCYLVIYCYMNWDLLYLCDVYTDITYT